MIEGLRISIRPNSPARIRQLRRIQSLMTGTQGPTGTFLDELIKFDAEIYVNDQRKDLSDFNLSEAMYIFNQVLRTIEEYQRNHRQ